MKTSHILLPVATLLFSASQMAAQCKNPASPNHVVSGSACVDKYEASLWFVTDPASIALIKQDKIPPLATMTQVGLSGGDWVANGCKSNGAGCTNIFALSLPKVVPAHNANYFVAAAACRNSGKRLLTNAEWQAAALGTPDPGTDDSLTDCNIGATGAVSGAGARKKCKSDVGAFDMVGNVGEFVADWGPIATTGTTWAITTNPEFGNDVSHVGGNQMGPLYGLPGVTTRGGSFAPGSGGNFELAGVYAIDQNGVPHGFGDGSAAGFRCGN